MEVSNQAFLKKIQNAEAGDLIKVDDDYVKTFHSGGKEFTAPALFALQDRESYHSFLKIISAREWVVAENEKDLVRVD